MRGPIRPIDTSEDAIDERAVPPLARGLRQTVPRRLVWDAMRHLGPHCTAEEIVAQIKARHCAVVPSTVYRVLAALEGSGAIRVVHFGGGPRRYEPAGEPHYHAVCQVCSDILHLPAELSQDVEDHLARDHHFRSLRIEALVAGVCARCAALNGQSPQPSPAATL